jgi:predicted DNA-binding protein (MmcQ/YjbR family)
MARVAAQEKTLNRVRKVCLALPDTQETLTWGEPHFRVANKIFAGCHEEEGRVVLGFKLEMPHAHALVEFDRRFRRAPYVGHKGWVSMDVSDVKNWNEVRDLVLESYRLIAPKKSLAKLGPKAGERTTARASKKKPARKKAGRGKTTANRKRA